MSNHRSRVFRNDLFEELEGASVLAVGGFGVQHGEEQENRVDEGRSGEGAAGRDGVADEPAA